MRRVWKFVIPVDHAEHTVELPRRFVDSRVVPAKPVHVACQETGAREAVTVWYEVGDPNLNQGTDKVELRVYGTGWDVPDGWEHVGTGLSGWLVWHLYARPA